MKTLIAAGLLLLGPLLFGQDFTLTRAQVEALEVRKVVRAAGFTKYETFQDGRFVDYLFHGERLISIGITAHRRQPLAIPEGYTVTKETDVIAMAEKDGVLLVFDKETNTLSFTVDKDLLGDWLDIEDTLPREDGGRTTGARAAGPAVRPA